MAQITIDIPENEDFSKEQWKEFLIKVIKERKMRKEESDEFRRIVSKSQATEKDVKELTDMIKEAVWKRHKSYHENPSNCDILSGDKTFRELCLDKVKTPKEILEMFEKI